jgi:biopolymer transport protein ExbD
LLGRTFSCSVYCSAGALRALELWDLKLVEIFTWLCFSIAGAGGFLLLSAAFGWSAARRKTRNGLRMFPDLSVGNILPPPRHLPIPLIAQLPHFPLVFSPVLCIVVFLFMILEGPGPHYGLTIDFKARDSITSTKSPWEETLSVYLAVGERYYVNNKPVKREALREALQSELDHRVVWTVYFEADYDVLNGDAIYAMDVIQGLGAKLIWITPKMRQELQQKKLRQSGRSIPE